MNKEFAWFLGYLLSDGSITRPTYRAKGDETHLQFVCKYDDRELMYKIKSILNSKAKVHNYPEYKSPQSKIRIYDKKEIINKFSDIKSRVPADVIKGYERHFIRGCFDGDGTLSYRKSRKSFRIGFIDEKEEITKWVADTITNTLKLPKKNPRWIKQSNVWETLWEGNIARLIAYWIYHGDINNCCLSRKKRKYCQYVLNNHIFTSEDMEMLYASHVVLDERDEVMPIATSSRTLSWCKTLQYLLHVNSTPVFHNKGIHKYYRLHISDDVFIANMRDTQLFKLSKA